MATDLIHDRGRGPELVGTRITVYNLLPYFLDATATEAEICDSYGLTADQVAAARAYVLNNPEEVFEQHLIIEKRIAIGNPPDVIERAKETHAKLLKFRDWLAQRKDSELDAAADSRPAPFPAFGEWLATEQSNSIQGQ